MGIYQTKPRTVEAMELTPATDQIMKVAEFLGYETYTIGQLGVSFPNDSGAGCGFSWLSVAYGEFVVRKGAGFESYDPDDFHAKFESVVQTSL